MKNIVLIIRKKVDNYEEVRKRIVHEILKERKYKILLMVVNPDTDKEYYKRLDGIENVVDSLELENMEFMGGIDYEIIKHQKGTQLHVENYAYRLYHDYQLDKYYYYSALSFWNDFFSKNKIDIVLNMFIYHGWAWDLANDIAEFYGIKSLFIESEGYNNCLSIVENGKFKPVYAHPIESIQYLLRSKYTISEIPPTKIKKTFFRNVMYKLGGNLLEDFSVRLFTMNWKPRPQSQQKKKITWGDKFRGYINTKRIASYVKAKSEKPKTDEKYIFYALHFEPEAMIHNRTILESQLVVIKMLSDALPNGWKIYVKEHPHQFDLNNDVMYSYLVQLSNFKSREFYEKLISINNVKLININEPSSCLIESSKAVSSITGTVIYEAVLLKKPVLIFSDLQPLSYMRDTFSIHSFFDCKQALQKIDTGFFPDYSDANDIVKKYIFKGEYVEENVMKLLENECLET